MMTQFSFLRKLFFLNPPRISMWMYFTVWFHQGCRPAAVLSLFTLTEAPDRSSLETFASCLNLTQIPCHNAQSDGACRHKSKYFRSWSYPTPSTRPHRHLNPPFPHQFQHCKPAICHKVIIELSIGEQLTVPPSSLFPPPHLLICSQTGKSKKALGVTHLIPLGFLYSLQINSGTGTKGLFLPAVSCPLFPAQSGCMYPGPGSPWQRLSCLLQTRIEKLLVLALWWDVLSDICWIW